MSVIVDLDFAKAGEYAGRQLSTKYNNKKHRVYIKLRCDETNIKEGISLAARDKGVLFIEYQSHQLGACDLGDVPPNVRVVVSREFGNNIEESGVSDFLSVTPEIVQCVICLPDDFDDIRFVYDMCMKYDRVRFAGGNLFRLDGVRLGYFDKELLEEHNVKYKEGSFCTSSCSDLLEIVQLEDIDIEIASKPESKKASNGTSKKKQSVHKKQKTFSQFLGNKVGL